MSEEHPSGQGSEDGGAMEAPPTAPAPPAARRPSYVGDLLELLLGWARDRFLGQDPTFLAALGPFAALTAILFSRLPTTNYIFDEQEALLGNPYVNASGGLRYIDAIHRDFWGLPPDRSIGSYRPIPDMLWRAIWQLSSKADGIFRQPFVHHIYNVFFHAINAALVTMIVWAWTKRRGQAWLAGLIFAACAVLTEAVSGIVGIADVLGGMGALLALAALSLPAWAMPFSVFMAVAFGLFSKESALVCVPLVPFAALLVAPLTHPSRPARFVRAALAFAGAFSAFYLYVELRKRWFPSPLPKELTEGPPWDAPLTTHLAHDFLVWFHQAPLPKDPLNNPLVDADKPHRIAGALRVYFRGLRQIVFPHPLAGDYSFPQEPIPDRLVFPESVAGAAFLVMPPLWSLVLWIIALFRERTARALKTGAPAPVTPGPTDGERLALRVSGLALVLLALSLVALDIVVLRPRGFALAWRSIPLWVASVPTGALGLGLLTEGWAPLTTGPRAVPSLGSAYRAPWSDVEARGPLTFSGILLVALGATWIVVSYFPHSNIPVVLPTVRAERFWYFPAIGSAMVLAVFFTWIHDVAKARGARYVAPAIVVPFLLFQCVAAYAHAMDYRSDVDFWRATKDAVPRSAKAHLNYSVMKGARKDLATRLAESKIALSLAPKWAMAHVYTGDTLCRMHRAEEAWPYYKEGFIDGPNDQSLISLALQCLYDENALMAHEDELRAIAADHDGSWAAYLITDTLANHEKNKGVDPKYRPRGYNEGPKE